jgi:hypothetical protein
MVLENSDNQTLIPFEWLAGKGLFGSTSDDIG